MVEWLKRHAGGQHSHDPTRAIMLCSWKRHFTTLFPACRFWQVVPDFTHIFNKLKKNKIKNFNLTAISWHLQKQVGVIACPMYSASEAFLRVRRINIEIK